jgi:pyruvate,water dikinase
MELLARTGHDPHAWRSLPPSCPFRRGLEAFLDEFGHRAVYEAEVAHPRWLEDPTYLLDQVRAIASQPAAPSPREASARARQRAEARLSELPFFLRGLARRLARGAAEGGARREAGKSAMAGAAMTLRKAALEVARRMVAAGVLDQLDDVFDLTLPDLRQWLDGQWDGCGACALIADRRRERQAWLSLPTRDVIVLDAEGNETEMPCNTADALGTQDTLLKPSARPSREDCLTGVAASPGVYHGAARVVLHPRDGARLRHGEILVAPSTDPGWTPLFLRAGAVVMQVGGYLSHGAIVAREFGLPAVVNVEHALERIADGQRITVDGNRGLVRLAASDAN